MSLIARHLEENGISTVTFSNARDITASACNPRTVFNNYPLGNACGRPYDVENQREILKAGFGMLENATSPGEIVDTPFVWSDSSDWIRLTFTPEQPWLSEEGEAKWLERKARNKQDSRNLHKD